MTTLNTSSLPEEIYKERLANAWQPVISIGNARFDQERGAHNSIDYAKGPTNLHVYSRTVCEKGPILPHLATCLSVKQTGGEPQLQLYTDVKRHCQALTSMILAILILLLPAFAASARADSINSLEITQSAMTCPECINWRISGMCFWLDCGLTGCDIKSSVRVSHRIPDLVVTAYSGGDSPWTETQGWNMSAATAISNRGRSQGSTDTDFKKVDVIGHPATLVFEELNKVTKGLFCKSCADAFKPYFISGMDRLGWHSGIPEMFSLNTLTGARVMGTPLVRFGNVWPRTGWTVHAEDPKSAALAAQRAADLVTSDEPAARVYQPIGHDCGSGCWSPPPVKENDASTHRWQMLSPVKQSGTEIFGQETGWARGKYTASEQYAWSLWRPYSCCRDRGSFLYSVTW